MTVLDDLRSRTKLDTASVLAAEERDAEYGRAAGAEGEGARLEQQRRMPAPAGPAGAAAAGGESGGRAALRARTVRRKVAMEPRWSTGEENFM